MLISTETLSMKLMLLSEPDVVYDINDYTINSYISHVMSYELPDEYNNLTSDELFHMSGSILYDAHELSVVNLELKQFCSAVSHDLKSPLNVLNMLIASLDDELGECKNGNVTEIMKMIHERSHKLVIMIQRLKLNFFPKNI